MNSKNFTRTRNFFTALFGAIAILGIVAFAPKADANPKSLRLNAKYVYRHTGATTERARDRAINGQKEFGAMPDCCRKNGINNYHPAPAPLEPEPKGPRRLASALRGFFNYTGKN